MQDDYKQDDGCRVDLYSGLPIEEYDKELRRLLPEVLLPYVIFLVLVAIVAGAVCR